MIKATATATATAPDTDTVALGSPKRLHLRLTLRRSRPMAVAAFWVFAVCSCVVAGLVAGSGDAVVPVTAGAGLAFAGITLSFARSISVTRAIVTSAFLVGASVDLLG